MAVTACGEGSCGKASWEKGIGVKIIFWPVLERLETAKCEEWVG